MNRSVLALCAALALCLPPPAAAAEAGEAGAVRAANADAKVAEQRRLNDGLTHSVAMVDGRWEVAYFAGDDQVALAIVDPASGEVAESWTGYQVAWKMARGYEGAFGHELNAPYVFLPLCALFLIGLLDWRRPWRVASLDLLVLLSFGVSHYFFNRAEIGVSVPLQYPALLYLLARSAWIGLRGRGEGLRPTWPAAWLLIAALFLLGFRAGLNVSDSGVIDVGYASTVGADRIAHGEQLYDNFPDDVSQGDTYGPATYLAYVPFEAIWPWHGSWDDLPAAHAAAVAFDLLAFAFLVFLGLRIRPGPAGRKLAATLGFAWAAYPYTAFALESNSNDTLVGALLVGVLLLLARPAARGALVALATLAKFAPIALAPLFATSTPAKGPAGRRPFVPFALAFGLTIVLLMAWPSIDPGLGTVYERTIGYQAGRDSPFSLWGQVPALEPLRVLVLAATAIAALAVALYPRRKSLMQVAALGAALLIALQLTAEHWFYLYIVWFFPLLLVALASSQDDARMPQQGDLGSMKRLKRGAEKAWRWLSTPPSNGASLLALLGALALLVVQLCAKAGRADTTSLGLALLVAGLLFATLAPGQTRRAARRITSFKVAGVELGLAAVAEAAKVKPPPYEDDGRQQKREGEDYPDVVNEMKRKLRFVWDILELGGQVEKKRDYIGIVRELWARQLLEDDEARFVLDLVPGRETDIGGLPDRAREEFLDAAWSYAVRFGSLVWDRHVRRALEDRGWLVVDFAQRPKHRPDFLATRGDGWVAVAARVGGRQVKCYEVARDRLADLDLPVELAGRCVVIPNMRKATAVSSEGEGAGTAVKVLRIATLEENEAAARPNSPCNDDERQPGGCD